MIATEAHAEPRIVASRWRWTYAIFAVLLLATPLVAMQFTTEVNWGPEDFAIFAAMLTGLGLLLEIAGRVAKTMQGRALLMFGAVLAFLLVWAELAVGLFD
ncbi:hypothetical protein LY632_14230 [Erythrobacter sp. SDW2]|uniref:hypothetical protein n=1 Tax=Erythrobacter sp. SDW2 TaxID=2907154 RepID=UPI001F19FEE5|nr:hypothetical protein [Erythrobacter sp. SDW2]UIP06807.1 hypothetical protein LY632_14230 [Erythrobacter sp. SDW2]